ncbi:hypothetical protein QTJ16_003153 [Diplocarpon rosae]|uniref:Kelch repeat protein n=1 Tax=Diplocarpon rosae TaxID=946125 RepID=A0AAD9T1Z1_9HELO|nr:hypothetical protein QTJ16_003153 [Diplocarpon rosae]
MDVAIVVGNYVYIDGGAFSYTSGGAPQIQYATTTLSIDLSKSWNNSSVAISSYSKPSGVPNLDCGSLWYNPKRNSLVAGFSGASARFNTPPTPWPLGLWSFKLDDQGGGAWTKAIAPTAAIASNSLTRPYQGLSAFGGDSAFTLGGYENDRSSPASQNVSLQIPIPGIVQYNMTSGTFTNSSASGYNVNGTAERGVLHYVPSFGTKGIYVILGGNISDLDEYSVGKNIQSFKTLTIFDPSTGAFYNQTTTGNIPNGRIEFCATGANSTNSTYEIFIYAGWGSHLGADALPYDEIYILTLPAFQWIKVPYPPAKPRHGHTCETVGNRQMLVIGGVDTLQDTPTNAAPSADLVTFATRDQFAQGLAIFDMTSLSWATQYDADAAAYEQSDPVKSYYATNSREPARWNSPKLQSVFSATHFTNTSDNPTTDSKSSSSTGAIAGGVVGGVLGLAAVAGLISFLIRRRQRAATTELPRNEHHYGAGGGTEMGEQDMEQGEHLGNSKPYAPVLSEAPGSEVGGREGYPQELETSYPQYETDARGRQELA